MPNPVKHICMADDDHDDYFLFESALREINEYVKLTYCSTGDRLLAYLTSTDDLPDLIVLDLNMPGSDCYTCLTDIKSQSRLRHIPVVVYSTSSMPSVKKRVMENGAHRYLVKPFSFENVKNHVKEILTIPTNA